MSKEVKEALTAVKMAIKFKQLNRSEKARRLFKQAMVLSPNDPDVLLHYGEFLESEKDLINAEHYYLMALILRPNNSRTHSNHERVLPIVNELDLALLKHIDIKKDTFNQLETTQYHKLKGIKKQMYFQLIYNSAAIEGNTMTLDETRCVIETGSVVPSKSILEYNEILGLEAALCFINLTLSCKKFITITDILEIHRCVFGLVDPVSAGTFRKYQVFVGEVKPPDASDVAILMEKFVESLQSPHILNMHPIHIAAYVHQRFVYIHPFIDGNGRTARCLMNLIFIKYGFPLIIIRIEDRLQYFEYLNAAHEGDLKPFNRFIAQATEDTLNVFLSACNSGVSKHIHKNLECKHKIPCKY